MGIIIGTGAATIAIHFISHNVTSEIGRLAAKVESLNREVSELRTSYHLGPGGIELEQVDGSETLQLSRQASSSFFSAHGSSGSEDDNDDDFEDTIEG